MLRRFTVFIWLGLASCGLKTDLVLVDDAASLPEIANLVITQDNNLLLMKFDIDGGSGAVAYHIDRAELDPTCKCPAKWLRFYESSPGVQRENLQRKLKLREDKAWVFRIRSADALGRKSVWSKAFGVDMTQQKEQ